MKYGLSEEQLAEIIAFLKRYPEVEQAILFGSRAMDTYKEASDIDIAIKGEKVNAGLAATIKFDLEENTYLPFFFDVIAYPTITNQALIEHIDTKGVRLFSGDEKSLWPIISLTEVSSDISYGYTASAIQDNDYPKFLRITDIVPKSIDWKNVPNCKADESVIRKYKLCFGDVVIARTGATTGFNKTIKNIDFDVIFASYLIRYRIDVSKAYPFFMLVMFYSQIIGMTMLMLLLVVQPNLEQMPNNLAVLSSYYHPYPNKKPSPMF